MKDILIAVAIIEQLYHDGIITESEYYSMKKYFDLEEKK